MQCEALLNLKMTLATVDEDSRVAANEAIREIVEKVVVHPIEIYGQLAALLSMSERAAIALEEPREALVAGARIGRLPRPVGPGRRWLRGLATTDTDTR